jgi:two-component system response regulator PilR (NtrC family)
MVLRGASVLVFEKDPHTRFAQMRLLMHSGDHVDGAASGREAFLLCRQRHFDVVITDLRLPDTTGEVLIRAIRAVSSHTCIVALTDESEPFLSKAREAGVDSIFSKSTDWARVLAYLRNRELPLAA